MQENLVSIKSYLDTDYPRLFAGKITDSRTIETYIQDFIKLEFDYMKDEKKKGPRLPDETEQGCVLVLLVGHTIFPLLQAVVAYNPCKVILVLNEKYTEEKSGEDFSQLVTKHIKKLPSVFPHLDFEIDERQNIILKPDETEVDNTQPDTPEAVFRKMRDHFLNIISEPDSPPLVIDVTGGKKSMVTGAYLFGAFSGVRLSYVDFDEYNVGNKAPVGYTCRIGLMKNPFETFKLRDWEKVRELYNNYAFKNAHQLLAGLKPEMEGWFSQDDIDAANRLTEVMHIYDLWENGDYSRAYKAYKDFENMHQITFQVPDAINVLGENGYWPFAVNAKELDKRFDEKLIANYHDSIYFDMEKFLTYACDELAKIGRLIDKNEDYRSAYLRGIGLFDFLLTGRILLLMKAKTITISRKDGNSGFEPLNLNTLDDSGFCRLYKEFIDSHVGLYSRTEFLKSRKKMKFNYWENNQIKSKYKFCYHAGTPFTEHLISGNIRTLRNKTTHTSLSIPENIAREAYETVRGNLDNFIEKWTYLFGDGSFSRPFSQRIAWTTLCEHCNVTFLPKIEEQANE